MINMYIVYLYFFDLVEKRIGGKGKGTLFTETGNVRNSVGDIGHSASLINKLLLLLLY